MIPSIKASRLSGCAAQVAYSVWTLSSSCVVESLLPVSPMRLKKALEKIASCLRVCRAAEAEVAVEQKLLNIIIIINMIIIILSVFL